MKTKFTFFIEKLSLLLFLVVLTLPGIATAQITAGSYGFTQSSGTYTPITGGTVLNASIPDSWVSSAVTLTPGFNFCGTVYTTAYITSNGLITLGGTAPASAEYNGIANTTGSGIAFSVFNADLRNSTMTGAAANIRYELVGNEHVFQWQDASRWATETTERYSFQARFNHVTGTITYVYTTTAVGTSLSYQPIIGIRTAATAGNWQNRLVGTGAETWATSLPGTATTSALRFTNSSPAKFPANGQTYVFTPPPNCSTTVAPAVTATTASPTTICLSGTVNLGLTTAMPPATGFTYQWQRAAVAAGPYTTIANTTTNTYAAPINATSFFRCRVLCNNDSAAPYWISTASPQVLVNNPGIPTVTPGSRCGPGVVPLAATPPAGITTLNWYANLTGGLPLSTGNTFTTPFIPTSTNFYVAASGGTAPASGWVGNGTTALATTPNPFYATFEVNKTQMLVKASELLAAGLGAGVINSIGFDVMGLTPQVQYGDTIFNLSISLKSTNINDLTTTFETMVPAYAHPAYKLVANSINSFTLTTPFPWDGSSNVIVEVCFANPDWGGTKNVKHTANLGFQASHFQYTDGNLNQCSAPTGTNATSTSRANIQFGMIVGCEGPRQAVLATVNPSPVVARNSPPVVCNDAVATITLTPPTPAYPTYTWSPQANLYTNAAGTTPYTAGSSATTIYMRTTNVGQQTYYMMAGNPFVTTGCTYADTVKIWSQPGNVTIKAQPDTICVSGTSTLKLDTIAGYFPGSIQWQTSTNGTNYTDIAGATNSTYVTPTLSFGQNTYYRAQIKAGSTICQSPAKYLVVANPVIVSAPDSFNCGPGSVTLNAVTGGNGTAVWYENASGGLPIASGTPFITPFLAGTTTYYVSSGGGGTAGNIAVGTGALSGQGSYSPFIGGWGGRKHQFLVKASELLAAGIPPGANLNSLGFDVTAGAGTAFPGFTISMKMVPATVADLSAGFQTSLIQVRNPVSHTIANGVNTLTFDNMFPWDGVSNIVVQTCWSNATNNSPYGSVKYNDITGANNAVTRYAQGDNQTPTAICGLTGGTTVPQRPQMIFGYDNRCESPREAVTAFIHPLPIVDLGADINKCVDEGAIVVLDAGVQPNGPQFLWDNNTTSQVRAVDASGNYNVKVTNQYTCVGSDTVTVILRDNPVVALGNDTTVCNGVVLNIDAGNDGIEYFWNTGSIDQSINVNSSGSYNVFVTNEAGCVKADTILITMQGELPSIQGINISNNGQYTFHFTAVNPQNVIGYDWDFGDGKPHSYSASPFHTYDDGGNYVVVLKLSSTCGFLSDTTSAHIVGIHQINVDNNELAVYPNPARDQATIHSRGSLKMEKIEVYNILGQVVYSKDADSKDKHTLQLSGLSSGLYTIQVFTDKGNVARKLEIIQ